METMVLWATVLFFGLAILWPIARLWWNTGVFGVVLERKQDPLQAFVGAAFPLSMSAFAVWAVVLYALGGARLGVWQGPVWVQNVGWTTFVFAVLLTVAAQANMGASWRIGIDAKPTALIAGGLYAFVRNPIYTGILAMLAGLVLIAPSAWTILGFANVWLSVGMQARLEEIHLEKVHGAEFRAWASRVGRFLPGLGRLDPL